MDRYMKVGKIVTCEKQAGYGKIFGTFTKNELTLINDWAKCFLKRKTNTVMMFVFNCLRFVAVTLERLEPPTF